MRALFTGSEWLLRAIGRLPLRRVLVVGLVTAAAAAAAGVAGAGAVRTYSTHGTPPLRTAIFDPFTFNGPQHAEAFEMTHAAGASYVRIVARWAAIAPADPPKDFVASDPASPDYKWGWLDTLVTAAQKAGLTPIVDVGGPPGWALVAKTKGQDGGTPKTTALQDFATAIATHYDGHHGAPTVHVWQIWNEANLSLDLSPVSAAHYRTMINAFAVAVHRSSAANIVVAGDLDPFRNKTKRFHTQAPLAFMRALLCVSMGNPTAKNKALRRPHATCHNRVDFEVWSHHPYTFRFPFVAYLGKSGVSVWGRDATSQKTVVTVQRRHGTHGGWRTVARIRANSAGIFKANLHLKATPTDWLRATAPGSGQTLAFSLNPPSPNLRYGPWGNGGR